jgi:surfeit locus 1 family protein
LHKWDYRAMNMPVPPTAAKAIPSAKGRARWLIAAITALAIAATAALGVWQLQRAAFKETLASQIESRSKLPAIDNFAPLPDDSKANDRTATNTASATPDAIAAGSVQALVHRRVNLRGLWLHHHTVFLDNRYMGGRPGFIVATPLQLAASRQVVWVQRGWVARDPQDRTRLPSLPATAGPVTVQGRVVAEVSRVYALGAPVEAAATASTAQAGPPQPWAVPSSAPGPAKGTRIGQNLPAVDFGPSTQLLSVAVLQTAPEVANAPDGLQRDWTPLDSGVAKHYGYAFQWFALCGLIMVLYAWFQFIAPRRRTL